MLWIDSNEYGLYSHTKLELVLQNCVGIEKLLAVLCCCGNVSIALQAAILLVPSSCKFHISTYSKRGWFSSETATEKLSIKKTLPLLPGVKYFARIRLSVWCSPFLQELWNALTAYIWNLYGIPHACSTCHQSISVSEMKNASISDSYWVHPIFVKSFFFLFSWDQIKQLII